MLHNKGEFMKKILFVYALALCVFGCRSKETTPDIVIGPALCEVGFHKLPGTESCVKDPVVITIPVIDYCNPKAKAVECEAQFSMQPKAPQCKKPDGDWGPSFFKDIDEADAYGKTNGFAFYINYRTPQQYKIGDMTLGWPWVCYPNVNK